jgi:hypothetical protein
MPQIKVDKIRTDALDCFCSVFGAAKTIQPINTNSLKFNDSFTEAWETLSLARGLRLLDPAL